MTKFCCPTLWFLPQKANVIFLLDFGLVRKINSVEINNVWYRHAFVQQNNLHKHTPLLRLLKLNAISISKKLMLCAINKLHHECLMSAATSVVSFSHLLASSALFRIYKSFKIHEWDIYWHILCCST